MLNSKYLSSVCFEVARLLKSEREAKGLSMTVVAAKAGLSQQMVSYVERGIRKPTLDTLVRLSEGLDVMLPHLIARALKTSQTKYPAKSKRKR